LTRTRQRRPVGSFGGVDSVPDLFAHAFERATDDLGASDLAILRAEGANRDVRGLGWLPADELDAVHLQLTTWRYREDSARYRLRESDRARLKAVLGNGVITARVWFVVAVLIDEVFSCFPADAPTLDARHFRRVLPVCPGLFDDIDNAPPPLGQMTPVAICRRWARNLLFTGTRKGLRVFGRVPDPRPARLPGTTRIALEAARDERALRIAVVCTPHVERAATRATQPGLFILVPSWTTRSVDDFVRLFEVIAKKKPELCVLPEGSVSLDELDNLKVALAHRAARFPSLLVAGLVHRAQGNGFVNEAVVLASDGREIMRHEKLEPFTDEAGQMEHIVPRGSAEYSLLDTPIGRIAVNVCRDVRSDIPMLLNRLFNVDVLLVPAWSKRLDFAAEEARTLGARQGTLLVAANAYAPGAQQASAVYLAIRSGAMPRVEPFPSGLHGGAGLMFSYEARIDGAQAALNCDSPQVF